MRDRYEREIDYLRISITDKCNLRCKYCMPGDIESLPMNEILTYEEITHVASAAAGLGIKRIKLTGGEPLVRRGACKLVGMLKGISGIEEVTLTTNGILLEDHIGELAGAGIDGINISIDTLDPERYRFITGYDGLARVMRGLDLAYEAGIKLKINAVSLDREPFDLIELTRDRDIDVRFIEMMPIGAGKGYDAISHRELVPEVISRYPGTVRDGTRHGNGPAVYYKIPGYKGSIGFISAIHGVFCDSCNRIRLTSQGFLKSCLCYDTGVDLKRIIRSDVSDDEKMASLRAGIEEAVLCKPKAHSFSVEEEISEKHAMSEIGG
ncbi:MAG: GTP 3',8-cyclase MoaA [Lachnospiraceae bacterium]|nr:GTP 3',8-cyclase MoaA [Lachnospiraceae bacterium]